LKEIVLWSIQLILNSSNSFNNQTRKSK